MTSPGRRPATAARLWLLALPLLLLAVAGGYLLGRRGGRAESATAAAPAAPKTIYTCSMHPQIRRPAPGNCPICEMPLVPVTAGAAPAAEGGEGDEQLLALSRRALALAGVETAVVTRRELVRELRAFGKIQVNERALATITPRFDGYVERLFVDFTGVQVRASDHLAEVYGPDLVVAQQEFLIALAVGADPRLVESARLKLRRWGIAEAEIAELEKTRRVAERLTLRSPITGTVLEKNAVLQGAFKAGDALYRVADLATVWVYLELYEMDLASVRYGQEVELRAEAWPGEVFHGQVTFINPVLDEATRTVKVPVHVANPDGRLRPGMFVSAVIRAPLLADGRAAPTGVEGRFSCPMHPQVLAAAAGACPLCEMPLRQIPPLAPPVAPADRLALAVPASAVLDSGVRQLVFVEVEKGHFRATPVTLGPRAGDWYMVLAGLAAGDEVAVRGNLLLDSQFQIQGLPSALTPPPAAGSPGPTPAAPPPPPPGHQH